MKKKKHPASSHPIDMSLPTPSEAVTTMALPPGSRGSKLVWKPHEPITAHSTLFSERYNKLPRHWHHLGLSVFLSSTPVPIPIFVKYALLLETPPPPLTCSSSSWHQCHQGAHLVWRRNWHAKPGCSGEVGGGCLLVVVMPVLMVVIGDGLMG